ncbi:MAG: methyltransferase domain-containing protein [Pseudomonadota bacterium]
MSVLGIAPWWLKIGSKLVLSRLPLDYRVWQSMGLFRHGFMDSEQYAFDVFLKHAGLAELENSLAGKTVLEIGPGDSVATAIIAHSFGANSVLIDAGNFAVNSPKNYKGLCDLLHNKGLNAPDLKGLNSIGELLERCESTYHTDGLSSWKNLATESVDFAFSQAVLEHIPRQDCGITMRECARVLKPDGKASHRVDLRDHLGGALNNLRFSERVWESSLFSNSGFYTNRIQHQEFVKIFESAGFQILYEDIRRWPALPTPRSKLAAPFATLGSEELCISGFDILMKKPAELALPA